jgi:hypothetical protein
MGPKKHHFVPQMHLRLFSVDRKGKQLVAFDKEKRATYPVAVEDAAAQGGYYTYETETGAPSLEFEALLAKIEGYAQLALNRLRAQQPPPFGGSLTVDAGDREWLAGYVALQFLRVPAQREQMQGMWNLLGTMQADIGLRDPDQYIKKEIARGTTRAEAERMRDEALASLQAGRIRVTSDPVLGLHYIQQGVGPVTQHVKYMRWLLLKRFEPPYFLLSDNPVQLWPPEGHPSFLGVGFATPGAYVTMPIDPMTLLVATKLPLAPEAVARAKTEDVFRLNGKLWRRASRFVYAPSAADLEATRAQLSPGDETYRRPTVEVVGEEDHRDWLPYIRRAKGRPHGRRKRRPAAQGRTS